ncbi:hypothetical protein QUF70_10055 [Desulfobacterales bacterium HSG17]|nr:hypothetical protein [Desulfobacterales bacterium HSG17]
MADSYPWSNGASGGGEWFLNAVGSVLFLNQDFQDVKGWSG